MKTHKKQLNQDRTSPESVQAAAQPDEDFARMLAAMFEAELGDDAETGSSPAPATDGVDSFAPPSAGAERRATEPEPLSDSALFRAIEDLLGPDAAEDSWQPESASPATASAPLPEPETLPALSQPAGSSEQPAQQVLSAAPAGPTPDRRSASLHTEPEEESPRGRKQTRRAKRRAEKEARRAARRAALPEEDAVMIPSADALQESGAVRSETGSPTTTAPVLPDRRFTSDTLRMELPTLTRNEDLVLRTTGHFDPRTVSPAPEQKRSDWDRPFTIRYETIRVPTFDPQNLRPEQLVPDGIAKSVPDAPEAEPALWSDERLFAEVDRILAGDLFTVPESEQRPAPSGSHAPDPPPAPKAEPAVQHVSAAAETPELPSQLTVPSAETMTPPGRGALIDTDPLPSLEELFPAPPAGQESNRVPDRIPAPDKSEPKPVPEPIPEPAAVPISEAVPEPIPDPEAVPESVPEDLPAAEPVSEPESSPAEQTDAAPQDARAASGWEELPSSRDLFNNTAHGEPPGSTPSDEEADVAPEQDQKQQKSQHRPHRRSFGSWLADLLHPKFNETPEDEPDFPLSSHIPADPLPLTFDTLPDQLPLEGFAAVEPTSADSAELPDQLPLQGFVPAPEEQEDTSPLLWPDAPAAHELSGETDAAFAAEPTPPVQTPSDPSEEPDEEDGPDLIPEVRNSAVPGGKNRHGSLSLRELLAAAVPMEETEPPLGSTRQKRVQKQEPEPPAESVPVPGRGSDRPAAPPENRARPIRKKSSPAVQPVKTSVPPAQTPPVSPLTPPGQPRHTEAEAAQRQKKQPADAGSRAPGQERQPAHRAAEPEENFRLTPSAQVKSSEQTASPEDSPPVPSASVRTGRERAAAASEPQQNRPEPAASRQRRTERPHPAPRQPEIAILHPEEAYRKYAKSVSTLGSRMVLTGLFAVLSLFLTLYLSLQWKFLPEIFSGGTSTYVLLALLIAMVLTNFSLYVDALKSLRGRKHSPDLLILLATVFTALDTFQAAKVLRPQFTAVIGLLLLISLWGKYDLGMALITTVKVLREDELAVGVSEVPDITKGSRGLTRTEPDVNRFMEKLETRDLCEQVVSVYTPIAALAGLALTLLVTFGLHRDPFWSGSLIMIGTVPLTGLIAFPRLFLLLSQRLAGAKTALCGYHGAEAFGGDHAILIGDDDIFPNGSLKLNGFKVYSGNPDRIIAYAAAATRSSGSALAPLFEDLLRTHVGRRYSVDAFRFYDSGGIGATIIGDVVLMGSLDFMRRMGVHMDKGSKVRQAVYLSINGELAAVFAVKYAPPDNLRRGLAAIANNRHFRGILVTRTFLGTPGFLKAKFGIPIGSFAFPSTKERLRLSEAELKHSGAQGAILAEDSFSGFAQAAAGGRTLRSASVLATILAMLAGSVGILLMAILAALPAYETATAVNLLLFETAWLAPTMLLSGWTRHF